MPSAMRVCDGIDTGVPRSIERVERHLAEVRMVALDDAAVLVDVDTPDALAAVRASPGSTAT